MKLNITFFDLKSQSDFLTLVGETDAVNLPISLINLAIKNLPDATITTSGEPELFHVFENEVWTDRIITDPVAEIKSGKVLEPAQSPIKLLGLKGPFSSELTKDLIWGQNRIANRYQPFVDSPLLASLTSTRTVDVIIVDSGINQNHLEFNGMKINNLYCVPSMSNDVADSDGHGTALASLIAGKNLGVNNNINIRLVNVKIFTDTLSPTTAELGLALDSILSYHVTSPEIPKIVNLSWSTVRNAYIDQKIASLIAAGLTVITAAGNTNIDIDNVSPAGCPDTFVVAASNSSDAEYVGVYGTDKKISLYAPGVDIGIASAFSNDQYATVSGSSASAAFASGIASVVAGFFINTPSSNDIKNFMISNATPLALTLNSNCSKAENKLLYRPDSMAIKNDNSYYAGALKIDDLTADLFINLRGIMPISYLINMDTPLIYTASSTDPIFASFINVSTTQDGFVSIKLNPNKPILTDKIKQFSFTITCEGPGVTFKSPDIFCFVTTSDATEADVGIEVNKLDLEKNLMFLALLPLK
jgi:hypothetical protein